MKVTVKNLEINDEYLMSHDAMPFTLNKRTTGDHIYSWTTVPRFFPESMREPTILVKYLFSHTKQVGLDDMAMPDQPGKDELIEECHEITFDEFSSYYEGDSHAKYGTIWYADKMYDAIFQTRETHDRIKEKYGRSVSLVYPAADCAVVRFYDPKKQVVGLVHSDAVHTTGDIIGKCVAYMRDHFGCNVDDIEVYVGAFAQDGWTHDRLPNFAKKDDSDSEINDVWKDYIVIEDGNYIIQYGDKIFDQLRSSGIRYENIYFDPDNTLFNDDYFSHSRSYHSRVDGVPTYREGRNLVGITFDYDRLFEGADENEVILK